MSSLTPRTVDGGFTVIDSVCLSNKTEIVMGRRESFYGINYATWECSDGNNYYWGHYDISTEQQARLDMFERAAERMRQILPEQYSQSEDESENSDEDECEM